MFKSCVSSLTIAGYKSIRELKDFNLSALNVLIGANGAGKSNFISLFRLLNRMYEQQLQVFVQQQGGPEALLHFGRRTTPRFRAEVYFGNNGYQFTLVPTSDNRLVFDTEQGWFKKYYPNPWTEPLGRGHEEAKLKEAKVDIAKYVQAGVSQWRVYHFHDTGENAGLKQRHAANDNLLLKPDAANLASFLRRLNNKFPEHHQRIVETIRLVAPFFGDFVHRDEDEEYLELEWTRKGQPDTPFKAHVLSDGTLRFICLATLLLQPPGWMPHTVLIDEPELGLHPYAISILAGLFREAKQQQKQLILATQSVELVNELSPGDVVVVEQEEGGGSTFRRFSQEELACWLEQYSLGELWKRNILGGRP
ncbi:MAG: AAA family ATPase [Magnetococcales bacterium]|nr:AAA family ATPase [Magnetococcales bacterium]